MGEVLHGIPGKRSQTGCGMDVRCSGQLRASDILLDSRWKEEVEMEEAFR